MSRFAKIINFDVANGPGVRVSLFMQGCPHHCFNCFNQETWDFSCGSEFTEEVKSQILHMVFLPYIKGLSVLGGEPMSKPNIEAVAALSSEIKSTDSSKTVWVWTGYESEDLIGADRRCTFVSDQLLQHVDVLVTGKYIEAQRDISDANRWRGSRNQRVLDVPKSLKAGRPIPLEGIPNNII